MASYESEELCDDLDGSEAHHTVDFSFRGRAYEIDLSTDNAEAFYNAIERYIDVARPVEYQDPRSNPPGPTPADIRSWAIENGLRPPGPGRISHSVRVAFADAHRTS